MEQELISKEVAIIGAGPAGCICAKFLKDAGLKVFLFDKSGILRTILPTGGGKCNLAHAEYDFKELAKNYPRGEKFLYSLFNRFGTYETIEFFKSIGVETYIRSDCRIFPKSNSASEVREKFLKAIKGVNIKTEKVLEIIPSTSTKEICQYSIITDKQTYLFDKIVIATGGKNYNLLKSFCLNIIQPIPSLVGLKTEKDYSNISGVSIKNVICKHLCGDILFTHKGISGPLVYTISSIYARNQIPYTISLCLISKDVDFQKCLDMNSHKDIKNLLGQFVPKSFAQILLNDLDINPKTCCHKIDGKTRDKIFNLLTNYEIKITGTSPDGEVVTCGGIDLKELNAKTLEAKKLPNIYFCGEILDVDGFCGGFNLQNCWTTGYIAAQSIIDKINTKSID